MSDERLRLQVQLESILAAPQGNFNWLVNHTSLRGFADIRVGDYWSGSRQLVNQPRVPSEFTLDGFYFVENILDELTLASSDSLASRNFRVNFMAQYRREYLEAWVVFANQFDHGRNKLRGRREWQKAVKSLARPNNPYFSVMRRIEREIAPVFAEGVFTARGHFEYFAEVQEFVGDEYGLNDSRAKKNAIKAVPGVLGKVGKLVTKGTKKGLKAKKRLSGKSEEQQNKELENAARAFDDYKYALRNLAINIDSKKLSYNEISHKFENPYNLASGDGAGSAAWASITELQRVLGKPRESNRLFWDLYTGPVRLAYQYMQEEAACYLQSEWEDQVLAASEGVSKAKLGEVLIGENGVIWSYVGGQAAPFLSKKRNKGFIPKVSRSTSMNWEPEFIEHVNNADSGREIVGGDFTVSISALRTGTNQSAQILPYATFFDLHCAEVVQTLANYNYSTSREFEWALSSCGDVTLRIDVGEYNLRKQYTGPKGFPKFLADFRDGHRVFTVAEFPEFESQLRNERVTAIDVNYDIRGQRPVKKFLQSVPLNPPFNVISCWGN